MPKAHLFIQIIESQIHKTRINQLECLHIGAVEAARQIISAPPPGRAPTISINDLEYWRMNAVLFMTHESRQITVHDTCVEGYSTADEGSLGCC